MNFLDPRILLVVSIVGLCALILRRSLFRFGANEAGHGDEDYFNNWFTIDFVVLKEKMTRRAERHTIKMLHTGALAVAHSVERVGKWIVKNAHRFARNLEGK